MAGLTAGSNDEKLEAQIRRFKPRMVALSDAAAAARLQERCEGLPVEILSGQDGLVQVARASDVDLVISAIVGGLVSYPPLRQSEVGNKSP